MKKNHLVPVAVMALLLAGGDAWADNLFRPGRQLSAPYVLADLILLRPFGFAMTVAGTGLLIATSPFTALASFAPPYDAFLRAGNALVVAPAGFTFNRPLGEMSYERSGVYADNTKAIDRPVRGPVPLAPQTVRPSTAPSHDYVNPAAPQTGYPAPGAYRNY
jgi:hypothetical protein